tara:strand:- start:1344 stop:2702 length:1359 start_codon:yes stop_codon:yes gene_type:complete
MAVNASGDGRPYLWKASTLLLPASLNLGISNVLAPLLNAMLARSVEPEAAIGGYAIALSIMMLIALPQLRIQQLTLVFLEDQASLWRIRIFVGVFAGLGGIVALLAALTPIRDILLDVVFATEGSLRDQTRLALIALVPFPVLAVIRTHLYGTALRINRPRLIWLGTGTGAATVMLVGLGISAVKANAGSPIAAIAVSAGAAAETVILLWATNRPLQQAVRASCQPPPEYQAMLRFFGPLLFAAFLPTVTTPIINAVLTRGPHPDTSVAAVALAWGVNQTFLVLMWGIQPTLLALMARGESPASGRRFAYVVAVVVTVPSAVVAFVPPLTSLVVHTLLGATGRLQDMTEAGLRVLAALPPLLVQEAIYTSAILSTRHTRLIVYVNILRLVGLLVILGVTVSFTDWPGGVIGVVAMGGSLVVEAITTMLYGYQSQKQLEDRWAARVSGSQALT